MITNRPDFPHTDTGSTATQLIAFDPESLHAFADTHRDTYVSGNPFPHIVIDDFLPEHVLDRVLDEFPSPQEKDWIDDGSVAGCALQDNAICGQECLLSITTEEIGAMHHTLDGIRSLRATRDNNRLHILYHCIPLM